MRETFRSASFYLVVGITWLFTALAHAMDRQWPTALASLWAGLAFIEIARLRKIMANTRIEEEPSA